MPEPRAAHSAEHGDCRGRWEARDPGQHHADSGGPAAVPAPDALHRAGVLHGAARWRVCAHRRPWREGGPARVPELQTRAGQRVQFYHYDPDVKAWYVYGMGTVSAAATQVQPDAKTRLYAFTGAMFNDGQPAPPAGENPGTDPRADPVDPSAGVFVLHKTDLSLPDVIPL